MSHSTYIYGVGVGGTDVAVGPMTGVNVGTGVGVGGIGVAAGGMGADEIPA